MINHCALQCGYVAPVMLPLCCSREGRSCSSNFSSPMQPACTCQSNSHTTSLANNHQHQVLLLLKASVTLALSCPGTNKNKPSLSCSLSLTSAALKALQVVWFYTEPVKLITRPLGSHPHLSCYTSREGEMLISTLTTLPGCY